VKEYELSGAVDKVIALSYATDSAQMQRFRDVFHPELEIGHYPPQELRALSSSFPVSYYIIGDTVRMKINGELPCSYVFENKQGRKKRQTLGFVENFFFKLCFGLKILLPLHPKILSQICTKFVTKTKKKILRNQLKSKQLLG
jgi:hypothetical protein